MNSVIKSQLDKVKAVKLEYNDNDTHISIKKQTSILNNSLVIGMVYLIEIISLDNSISLNDCGRPTHKFYKVELCDKVLNVYRFNGIPIENGEEIYSENFYYWLDSNDFKVLEKY